MGELADDFEAWADSDAIQAGGRLGYLNFIKCVVFATRPTLEVVKCRKYPEFGMIRRENIDKVIHRLTSCRYCYQEGCDVCIPGFAQQYNWRLGTSSVTGRAGESVRRADNYLAQAQSAYDPAQNGWTDYATNTFNPDALVGKQIQVSLDPGNPTTGLHYWVMDDMTGKMRQILNQKQNFFAELYGMEEEMGNMDPDFWDRQAAAALEKAEILRTVPQADVFDNGTTLTFNKKLPPLPDESDTNKYFYSATKAADRWWVTGERSASRLYWQELLNFIGLHNLKTLEVVTNKVPMVEYVGKVTAALEAKTGE